MNTHKTTRIVASALLLALCTAGAPLWAQTSGAWPAWQGKANADKKAWDEMGACWTEFRILGFNVAADVLGKYKNDQKQGVKFWKKNKVEYLDYLAEVQAQIPAKQAAAQKTAEQAAAQEAAKQKAEEEWLAAANAKGLTEEDFDIDLTPDGKGLIITKYKGMATAVKIPASFDGMPVWEIGGEAFYANENITSVVIPEGVTIIRANEITETNPWLGTYIRYEGAFQGCKKLVQVTLPSTLRSIEQSTFRNTALTTVVIPKGVTEIRENVFEGCAGLTSVTIPNSVTKIDSGAFFACASLASITIPNSVTKIGEGAFIGCTGLASITIPNSVKEIGKEAFKDCTGLTSITIPNSVTEIGEEEFSGCTGLTSIAIPDSVKKIDKGAFKGCTSLTTVTISPVKREWYVEGRDGPKQFEDCPIRLPSQGALKVAGYTGNFKK
jgi:hypothetical protein